MKKIKNIYKIELLILLSIIILFSIDRKYQTIMSIIILGMILFGSLLIYDKKKDNNFLKWSATKIVVAMLIFYYIVISILGISLGFSKTLFSLNISRLFQGAIPVLTITLINEYLRFILIKNNFIEKKAIYIITILMILLNITINSNINILTDSYKIFIFICTVVIPIIAQELLGTYMVLYYGFLPAIVYKLSMNLYLYLVPISTDLGEYLYGVVNILIPFTIYTSLKRFLSVEQYTEKNKRKIEIKEATTSFFTMSISIFLITSIILVSGISKYHMIAIASNSMNPIYYRGDAVIYEKVEVSTIEVGDIIVFERNSRIITHRVIKIKEDSNILYFYTKGDANNATDAEPVKQEKVRGVVKNIVKYIGYPTIKINEMMGGNI